MRKLLWGCVAAGAATVCGGFWTAAYVSQNPDSALGRCALAVCPAAVSDAAAQPGRRAVDGDDLIPADPVEVDDTPPLPTPGSHIPPEVAALMAPPPIVIHDDVRDEEDLNPATGPYARTEFSSVANVGAESVLPSTVDIAELAKRVDEDAEPKQSVRPAGHAVLHGGRRAGPRHALLHGRRRGQGRHRLLPPVRRRRFLDGLLLRPIAHARRRRSRTLRGGRPLSAAVLRLSPTPANPARRWTSRAHGSEAGAGLPRRGRAARSRRLRRATSTPIRRGCSPTRGIRNCLSLRSRDPTRWKCGPATGSRTASIRGRSKILASGGRQPPDSASYQR